MKIGSLGRVLDSKRLVTRHLHNVANKTTGVFCNIFPSPDIQRPLSPNKVTLYKLRIRYILTYAATVCSPTCPSNYLTLQVIQSECLRIIGNHPRHTPQFPPALHSKSLTHPRYYPPTYIQMFCSLPLTPQPPGPTNRELYSSRLDKRVQKI